MYKLHKTMLTMLGAALLLATGVAQAQTAPASTAMPAASTAMPAAPAAMPAASTPMPVAPAATHKPPAVVHAQFTTAVSERVPADDVSTLDSSHDQVFFFSVLKDAAGQTITHRWEFNGKTMAEVKFEPKADHWRVWSSKKLMPDQTGTWTVEVLDGSGNVLMSKSFDYTRAQTADMQATPKGKQSHNKHKVQPQASQSATTMAPATSTGATPPLN